MTSPPIISYATDPGTELSIVPLEGGGVDINVPPQGWLWFTHGRRRPLVRVWVVAIAFAVMWVFLFRQYQRGVGGVIYALPVAVLQAAFVAFGVMYVRSTARKRVRVTATRTGLWVHTAGAMSAPREQFFPIEKIADVDVKWRATQMAGPQGSMTVTIRGGGTTAFLDHCRGKDVVEVVNQVRRALGMWPRSYTVPKGA